MTSASFEPNYDGECACGQSPTVDLIDGDSTHHSGMCGVCFFGTSEALDTDWWVTTKEDDNA